MLVNVTLILTSTDILLVYKCINQYGRLALNPDSITKPSLAINKVQENAQSLCSGITTTSTLVSLESSSDGSEFEPKSEIENAEDDTLPTNYRHHNSRSKPFQRVQFLVRDWQNFSCDWPEPGETGNFEDRNRVYAELKSEMKSYMDSVIKPRGLGDLQSTRDQILRCFESIDCFLLPVSTRLF